MIPSLTTLEYIARWYKIFPLAERFKSGPDPELFHLITTGHLLHSERDKYAFYPAMMCAFCDAPCDLIYMHKPVQWPWRHPISTVHGKDVAVVCPNCSRKSKRVAGAA